MEPFTNLRREDILTTLDHSNDGHSTFFVSLGEAYSYLIDSRINVFRSDNDCWAIVIERLGYNPRGGVIFLDLYYYGNCFDDNDLLQEQPVNYYSVYPVDFESFESTIEDECLLTNAEEWRVRGKSLPLTHDNTAYIAAGIDITESECIRIEEAARFLILEHANLFRATDEELFRYLPTDLHKILVLNEWFHKDFHFTVTELFTDDRLKELYDFNLKLTGIGGISFDEFADLSKQQHVADEQRNNLECEQNRPSSYETWPLIADVLVSGDIEKYKPTLSPNSHWKFWPDSGSL